jgi:hypothetical protein
MTVSAPKPRSYPDLLATLKARIRAARLRAAVSVNRDLILLYWEIGRDILLRQAEEGWGAPSSIAWPVTCGGIFPLSPRRNGRVGELVLDGGLLDA